MTSTFPRNPQRGYCYDLQPEISHPEWLNFGEQVAFANTLREPLFSAPISAHIVRRATKRRQRALGRPEAYAHARNHLAHQSK